MEGRLLEIARGGYFEGPVKKLLSGVRIDRESRCHTVPGTGRKIPGETWTEKEQQADTVVTIKDPV